MAEEKIKSPEQIREEFKKEFEDFTLKVDGVIHLHPNIVKFIFRGREIDLRTAPEQMIRIIAADPGDKVLGIDEKVAKAAAKAIEKEALAAAPADVNAKETSSNGKSNSKVS